MIRSLLAAAISWACITAANANTLSWFCDPAGDKLDSNDQPMDAGYEFQLGVFDTGFEPDAANIASWLAHWNPADSAQYDPVQKRYAGVYEVEDNAAPFLSGAKAWVFGRRTGATGSEWILFRNSNWLWPDVFEINPPDPFGWNAKNANEVVLGTIHSSGSPFLMQSAFVRSYAQWQAAELTGEPLNAAADDPDRDGRSNLLEFVFGTAPKTANAPVATPVVLQSGHAVITIPRRIDHLVNCTVEVSGNLVNWQSGPAHTEVLQDAAAALVVRDRTPVNAANPQRFIRLKATLP
jgi:hypothetical protein